MKILSVFGTRPEAIKMAIPVRTFAAAEGVESVVCVTGQHRQMLDQVLSLFEISPDIDLDLMTPGQSLERVTTRALEGVSEAIRTHRPDWIVVQGDTTTAMAGALAGFYAQVPVAHVEAGLRTGNMASPWPEEGNRQIIGRLAKVHFPPTAKSQANLLAENIDPACVHVTGNTVIDALHYVSDKIEQDAALAAQIDAAFDFIDPAKRLILVTGHRRENFNGGLDRVCDALARLAARGDVQIVYPVHLNPQVQRAAEEHLRGAPDVHLIAPLDYLPFVRLMSRADLIITDSGGIQEEAPSLGKPVLVTRDTTERPEAVEAGTVKLVGTQGERVIEQAARLLDDEAAYAEMARAHNPYGDGHASERILQVLRG
ncbi:MAG: UDP-N-acetylglucosamine 2-epimerase (non-hydrolyzing) [Neomegalonema sp.]|nr:UDP-N-acetylglucosamine 2-epimerase (non-hydrolyzing) [Neomegalonema sp.]